MSHRQSNNITCTPTRNFPNSSCTASLTNLNRTIYEDEIFSK